MELVCGPFNLIYEKGFLRQISLGGREVLRMIYFALRDENWGTLPLTITNEKIFIEAGSFSIEYVAANTRDDQEIMRWMVRIVGDKEGKIAFSIDGVAEADLWKNRAGFCVLHPLKDLAGESVIVTHTDGTSSISSFPVEIEPYTPFADIEKLSWKFSDHWYCLKFTGDVFETEDQRNWTDASYKTYCTPLGNPFPVQLRKHEMVKQEIVFYPMQKEVYRPLSKKVLVSSGQVRKRVPHIGTMFNWSAGIKPKQVDALSSLGLDHLRVDIDPLKGNPENKAVEVLRSLNIPLEVVLHLGKDKVENVQDRLTSLPMNLIRSVTLLSQGELTTNPTHLLLVKDIRQILPHIAVGAGTDYNFTEINRYRFDPEQLSFISYAIQPQEHSFDDLSIVENIEAQAHTVLSCQKIYGKAIHVSPVTLRKRFNPYATDRTRTTLSEQEQYDPRHPRPFAAAWTLGTIKSLASADASSVTLYRAFGDLGLVDDDGELLPVAKAIASLKKFPSIFLETTSSRPVAADGITFSNGEFLLWNYGEQVVDIDLNGLFEIQLTSQSITSVSQEKRLTGI